MIPQDKKIKKVQIQHDASCIRGFKFFDKNQLLIFEIGEIKATNTVTEVVLEENEQIIGVAYKLYSTYQTVYTDFQF